MISIDRRAEQIRRRDDLIHRLYQLVIALAAIIIVLSMMIVFMTHGAGATQVCLSKSEARKLWPRKHIYWYGDHGDHCWSNRRGPPRGIKVDPIPEPKRAQEVMPDDKTEPRVSAADEDYCCWPALDADASGNLVEPPQLFAMRWYEFPKVFTFYRQRLLDK
jgi:hypothetical protein